MVDINFVLSKKENARECPEYRTISLMRYSENIPKVIHNRIYKKLVEDLGDTQCGFRNSIDTREAKNSQKYSFCPIDSYLSHFKNIFTHLSRRCLKQ